MLSKSLARALFLASTLGFSLLFLGLTVDTIRQVPERSHADQLSPQVIRGKHVWEDNNCMGCHTLLGEGAYYAPELTKVVERRGVEWLRVFLKDPEAMYPGQRRMVKYDFQEGEIDDVIAFLGWIGNIDTNGFPRDPDMAPKPPAPMAPAPAPMAAAPDSGGTHPPSALASAPPIYSQLCQACHAVEGKGGVVGPALDGVGQRFDPVALDAWLKDPQSVKPGTAMPNLGLTDDVRADLVKWLSALP